MSSEQKLCIICNCMLTKKEQERLEVLCVLCASDHNLIEPKPI